LLTQVGAVINFSFQKFASTAPFSLNALRLVNSATALKIDWNLPFHFLLPLSLFVLFSLVPAAIWSGALTPNVVSKNVTVPYTIPAIGTVDFTDNALFHDLDTQAGSCPWLTGDIAGSEEIGTFHSCYDRMSIINSAAMASTVSPIPGHEDEKGLVHAKLDRSSYSFVGRSYGTGGSIGFANMEGVLSPLSMSLAEPGLYANVTCIRNDTAAFYLAKEDHVDVLVVITAWGNQTLPEDLDMQIGKFPTSFPLVGYVPPDVFAWGSAYNNKSTSYISLAAMPNNCVDGNWTQCQGYGFAQLHKTQCRIDFSAKSFDLEVDNVGRTIAVTPKETIPWPTYADSLLMMLAAEHSYISKNDGAFGGSVLGRAIRSNINLLRAFKNERNFTKETTLQGIESFVQDVMDNSLLAFSQSSYFGKEKEKMEIFATVARNVVVYGESKFIYAAVVLNVLIIVICLTEAVRSRFWSRLPDLDLLDMASVAVGASLGGSKLAEYVQSTGPNSALLPGQRLAARDAAGDVKIRLRHTDGGMSAIEPAGWSNIGTQGDEMTLLGKQKYTSVAAEEGLERPGLSYEAGRHNSYSGPMQSPYSNI
jgi:hypothetical protein